MTTAPSLTLPVAELHRLLTPVLPMASRDDGLPVLCAVLVEVDDGQVFAWATDRFNLGLSRLPVEGDEVQVDPAFRALIPVDDVKHLLSLFRVRRGHADAAVRLTVESDNQLRVESAAGLFEFASVSVAYRLLSGAYPNTRSLLVKELSEPRAETSPDWFICNPDFLAKFKAAGDTVAVDLPARVGRPAVIRVGDRFVGLLMPRRTEADLKTTWIDRLTTTTTTEKRTA